MAKYCVGIDLGGTSVKFGLLDGGRRPGEPIGVPTPTELTGDGLVELMAHGAERVIAAGGIDRADVVGVGIGAPGPLAISKGIILAMPNLPGVENFPIRDRVGEALCLPAVLENDANAAALGEFLCGAAKDSRHIVMLTLGTGIGGAAIIDGRILHGAHEIGAEFGHMIVQPEGRPCGCGQRGCIEQYASAFYIAKHARRRIEQSPDSCLAAALRGGEEIDAAGIVAAASEGDTLAGEIWDEAMRYLAGACVSFCRIFDPDEIVLAGGMTKAGDALLEPLRRHFADLRWSILEPMTRIAIATLGSDAGFIGAAGVAWRRFGEAE